MSSSASRRVTNPPSTGSPDASSLGRELSRRWWGRGESGGPHPQYGGRGIAYLLAQLRCQVINLLLKGINAGLPVMAEGGDQSANGRLIGRIVEAEKATMSDDRQRAWLAQPGAAHARARGGNGHAADFQSNASDASMASRWLLAIHLLRSNGPRQWQPIPRLLEAGGCTRDAASVRPSRSRSRNQPDRLLSTSNNCPSRLDNDNCCYPLSLYLINFSHPLTNWWIADRCHAPLFDTMAPAIDITDDCSGDMLALGTDPWVREDDPRLSLCDKVCTPQQSALSRAICGENSLSSLDSKRHDALPIEHQAVLRALADRMTYRHPETQRVLLTETFPAETGSMRARDKAFKSEARYRNAAGLLAEWKLMQGLDPVDLDPRSGGQDAVTAVNAGEIKCAMGAYTQ
ncbi:hypothetical protein An19g00250 [Aspergillus niger]|uniref:Uncharacterized protein n=2 Tax=Aspergillus niger TaxID=5061 RepID=A2RBL0_ASPNC|nr:hypothetical protein An19g00250 [Aspergillus niger]CAK47348.1 hypothetical protein An19g00250 [Aspergillus niger]